jgi:hypothetical protein
MPCVVNLFVRASCREQTRHSERNDAEPKSGPAIAAGDDNDIEMDGGPVKNGDRDSCGQPALPPEAMNLCQYSGPVYGRRPPGKTHAGLENPAKKRLTPDHVSVKLPQVNPKQKAILPAPRSVKKAIPYQFSRKA